MGKKILFALLAAYCLPASAGISYYNGAAGESAFATALIGQGLTASGIVNFSGVASGTVLTDVGGTGTNFAGFVGNSPTTLNVSGSTASMVLTVGSTTDRVAVTLGSNVYAYGMHVAASILPTTWCFGSNTTLGCSVSQGSGGTNNSVFFGVISDAPLSPQAIWSTSTVQLVLQDFQTYSLNTTTSETPEPSTLALMGFALMALPLARCRRK